MRTFGGVTGAADAGVAAGAAVASAPSRGDVCRVHAGAAEAAMNAISAISDADAAGTRRFGALMAGMIPQQR